MCLLIVLFGVIEGTPLVVAANRDERLDRPATPMTVLRNKSPRILGGRDALAGGTWLAVNDHGLVAGLTNRPSAAGRDDTKRSRGQLPLALAAHLGAARAAQEAVSWQPADYNPAWLLFGDRKSLYYVDLSGNRTVVRQLDKGVHVLENRALGEESPKVNRVTGLLDGVDALSGASLVARLSDVLRDHVTPNPESAGTPPSRPVEAEAACVHSERYGTRSSAIVQVSANSALPQLIYSHGPPCVTEYLDATKYWGEDPP